MPLSLDDRLVLSSKLPENTIVDGKYSVGLWDENHFIAVSSVSRGLEYYYGSDHFLGIQRTLKDEYVLVQMQGFSSRGSPMNYRNALTRFWVSFLRDQGVPRLFYLNSRFNFWCTDDAELMMLEQMIKLPKKEVMLYNYDWTATRNGFRIDPSTGVYVKQLID